MATCSPATRLGLKADDDEARNGGRGLGGGNRARRRMARRPKMVAREPRTSGDEVAADLTGSMAWSTQGGLEQCASIADRGVDPRTAHRRGRRWVGRKRRLEYDVVVRAREIGGDWAGGEHEESDRWGVGTREYGVRGLIL